MAAYIGLSARVRDNVLYPNGVKAMVTNIDPKRGTASLVLSMHDGTVNISDATIDTLYELDYNIESIITEVEEAQGREGKQ